MDDLRNQVPKGSDLSVVIYGNDTYPISEVYDNTTAFSLLLYPDNLDLSVEENRLKVISVKSTVRSASQDNDRGYCLFDTENERCTVLIPWTITRNLTQDHYTVDIVWGGENNRVVFRQNSMVVIVESSGTYVDGNMDFNEQ